MFAIAQRPKMSSPHVDIQPARHDDLLDAVMIGAGAATGAGIVTGAGTVTGVGTMKGAGAADAGTDDGLLSRRRSANAFKRGAPA